MSLDHGCVSLIEDQSPMAQSVARQAVNLQVAGSNPAGGGFGEPGLLGRVFASSDRRCCL